VLFLCGPFQCSYYTVIVILYDMYYTQDRVLHYDFIINIPEFFSFVCFLKKLSTEVM